MNDVDRRKFLQTAGVMTIAASQSTTGKAEEENSIPQRILGKTKTAVTILGLGGEHVLSRKNNDATAEEVIGTAFESGVNYFDTAEQYFPSEKYLGQALKGRRERAFISTKVDSRDPEQAKRLIERSLKLLQTDYFDNLNIHRVRNADDVERLCKKGGLLEVVQQAKAEGVTRHIGITGHYLPEPLIEMMRRADLDTVLLPVNAADDHFHSFRAVRQEAHRRNMGVIAMKVSGRGRLLSECGFTEMAPLLNYALSQDVHVAIVGVDNVSQLRENVEIAKGFTPMSAAEQQQLQQRLQPHAQIASFYKSGSTSGWLD